MNCLLRALRAAGVSVPADIEDSLDGMALKEMPELCSRLGLVWHQDESIEFADGIPVIVIFKTRPGIYHAAFTREIAGVIEL